MTRSDYTNRNDAAMASGASGSARPDSNLLCSPSALNDLK